MSTTLRVRHQFSSTQDRFSSSRSYPAGATGISSLTDHFVLEKRPIPVLGMDVAIVTWPARDALPLRVGAAGEQKQEENSVMG